VSSGREHGQVEARDGGGARDRGAAPADSDATHLVARILADARAEAARVVEEASRTAALRSATAADEGRAAERQARERAAERLAVLERNTVSRINVEARRARLRVRDRMVKETQDAARARLAAMIGTAEYRRMLVGWIAEAAVGLGEPEAEVNASAPEKARIDAQLLAEAERDVHESVGREVRLRVSAAQPLLGQGVVLNSLNGRLAYNNQVATRLLREQARIRALIHGALFTGAEERKA
jgi:vacuolar-type H+-ATPase subunit E/Vma4